MDNEIGTRIERLANSLPALVGRLKENGYRFKYPNEVFPGPDRNVEEKLKRIRTEVEFVPLAVAAFWRRIGSINLIGSHPDWSGCDYPDPLVVECVDSAIVELDEYLDRADNDVFRIPIAPDYLHKENVSGGMWYNVVCQAPSDDPIVSDERHKLSFLDYIELAVELGGFLGLDQIKDHTYPIEDLKDLQTEM